MFKHVMVLVFEQMCPGKYCRYLATLQMKHGAAIKYIQASVFYKQYVYRKGF